MPAHLALLFDFDGTLYVGDLPVLAYARHCAEQLPRQQATELIDGIRFFLEGKATGDRSFDRVADFQTAQDGYQAVEILGSAMGLTGSALATADRRARSDLAASAFALDAPDGLLDLLGELRDAYVMVVTNTDAVGVAEVLAAIGLTDRVDELITDAGKPGSMPVIVETTLRRIGALAAPGRLLAIGDRWSADLADAAHAGAATAMIDRFERGDGTPDLRAPDLAGLLPGIRRWARQQGSHVTQTSTKGPR